MNRGSMNTNRGFSLVELVIVIVIIGIIAAIAVPRYSSATDNANDKQVAASIAILQNAIDLYVAEHIGADMWSGGVTGTETSVTVAKAILKGTLNTGAAGTDYGPYMRKLPSNTKKGDAFIGIEVDDGSTSTCTAGVTGDNLGQTWTNAQCGWVFDLTDYSITAKP